MKWKVRDIHIDWKKANKWLYWAAVAVVGVLLIVSIAQFATGIVQRNRLASDTIEAGKARMIVRVCDGFTEEPLAGATVVIPETGKTYKTDSQGSTGVIEVPVQRDMRYDRLMKQPWGEVTILAFQEGYVDYALFHVNVTEQQTRQGPTVMMFKKGDIASDDPLSLIEGPPREWLDALMKKYRK